MTTSSPPSACVCEDQTMSLNPASKDAAKWDKIVGPTPAPPSASAVTELARELAHLQDEHSRVLFALSNRRVRTQAEAVAVARLGLALPACQGYPLLCRVARFVRVLDVSQAASGLAQPTAAAGVGQ
jgi:hypothetical protein